MNQKFCYAPQNFLRCLAVSCLLGSTCQAAAVPARNGRIITFGDSTTAPRLVEGKALRTYTDLLAEYFLQLPKSGAEIINAGVPGNTTRDARARFHRDVLARKPTIVIIQFGINDSTVDIWKNPPVHESRVPLDEYVANLYFFVTELRKLGSQPILMTPNPMNWTDPLRSLYGKPPYKPDDQEGLNLFLQDYAQAVRELAKSVDAPLVDVYAAFQEHADKNSMDDLLLDGMHPNEKGHRLIAGLLRKQALLTQREAPPVGKLECPVGRGGQDGSTGFSPEPGR